MGGGTDAASLSHCSLMREELQAPQTNTVSLWASGAGGGEEGRGGRGGKEKKKKKEGKDEDEDEDEGNSMKSVQRHAHLNCL